MVRKLKNSNCDKTKKTQIVTKNQIMTKPKPSNCDNLRTQIVTKLKPSNCDNSHNSNFDQTQNVKL